MGSPTASPRPHQSAADQQPVAPLPSPAKATTAAKVSPVKAMVASAAAELFPAGSSRREKPVCAFGAILRLFRMCDALQRAVCWIPKKKKKEKGGRNESNQEEMLSPSCPSDTYNYSLLFYCIFQIWQLIFLWIWRELLALDFFSSKIGNSVFLLTQTNLHVIYVPSKPITFDSSKLWTFPCKIRSFVESQILLKRSFPSISLLNSFFFFK